MPFLLNCLKYLCKFFLLIFKQLQIIFIFFETFICKNRIKYHSFVFIKSNENNYLKLFINHFKLLFYEKFIESSSSKQESRNT